jgi:hypothetical protein
VEVGKFFDHGLVNPFQSFHSFLESGDGSVLAVAVGSLSETNLRPPTLSRKKRHVREQREKI